jgi:hypothetical protein
MVLDPGNLPMVFAAFTLIQSTAKDLCLNLDSIFQQTGGLASQLSDLRALFSVSEVKNQVVDGTEKLKNSGGGICLEFEWVLVATLPQLLIHGIPVTFLSNILEARAMHCAGCRLEFNKVKYV